MLDAGNEGPNAGQVHLLDRDGIEGGLRQETLEVEIGLEPQMDGHRRDRMSQSIGEDPEEKQPLAKDPAMFRLADPRHRSPLESVEPEGRKRLQRRNQPDRAANANA